MNSKIRVFGIFIMVFIVMLGCNSSTSIVKPDLTSKSPAYKKAFNDGCTTAQGYYTKDHHAFKTRNDYNDGWFEGRRYCQYR